MIHRYNIVGSGIGLTAATAKTVAAILPGTTRVVRLLGINIGFDSTTTTDAGVTIEVVRFDGTGAGTSTTTAPVAVRSGLPAAISGGRTNFTAEPTVGTVLWATKMTPIGSTIILPFPPDREIEFLAGGANAMLGVRCTAPQAQSGLVVTLEFAE